MPLPDASFDLALSEYGASIWADPERWIPRRRACCGPAGGSSSCATDDLAMLCSPDTRGATQERCSAPVEMNRFEWSDGEVEFHSAAGDAHRRVAGQRLRDRAADRALRRPRAPRRTSTTTTSLPTGDGSGRRRRSGSRGSGPMGPGELTDHAQRNRAHWTGLATSYARPPRRAWQREPNWGCWGSPDSELTCWTTCRERRARTGLRHCRDISSWLARRGARVVGLDVTPAQLETARRKQAEFGSSSSSWRRAQSRSRCRTRASISSCPSSGQASCAIRTSGSRRPLAFSGRAAGSCFS